MKPLHIIRSLASIAALVGGLALLLADDAGPQCQIVAFDRTFTIGSSCGPVSETVRITVAGGPEIGTVTIAGVEHVAADMFVASAELSGTCGDDGPIEYESLSINLTLPGPSGEPLNYLCTVNLETLVADCYLIAGTTTGDCAVTVTGL